jgi:hypothetical protein
MGLRGWTAALCVLGAAPALGQSLSLERDAYVVGSTVMVDYATGGDEDDPLPTVVIVDLADGGRLDSAKVESPGSGRIGLTAPADPGRFAARLVDPDGAVLAEVPFAAIVTPAPGALSVGTDLVTIGEAFTVTVAMPADRYASYPWVGLFARGGHASGGASTGDHLLESHPAGDAALTFTAPAEPGTYDLRLFDRSGPRYMIDTLEMLVEASPAPDAITLPKTVFTVGETMNVIVALPPDRYYSYPRIGLFAPPRMSDAGAGRSRTALAWQTLDPGASGGFTTFTAPAWPGDYELRLYDREGGAYLLDRAAFTVEVPRAPGALSLDTTVFTIGAPIRLSVVLPDDRYYSYPWVGLFRPGGTVAGGAATSDRQLEWHRASDTGEDGILDFTAPGEPGPYQLRLYDRDDGFLLDTLEIRADAAPAPGTLSLDRDLYVTGEPIAVSVALPPDRYYAYPWVGLFRPDAATEAGAGIDERSLEWYRADPAAPGILTFTAPELPGDYLIRAYDRDGDGFVLDTIGFRVQAAAADLVSVAGRSFAPGEPIVATAASLEGRTAYYPALALFQTGHVAPGGALVAEAEVERQTIGAEGASVTFTAPETPGPYEVRLYDRSGSDYVVAAIPIEVRGPDPAAEIVRFTPLPGTADTPTPRPHGGAAAGTGGSDAADTTPFGP